MRSIRLIPAFELAMLLKPLGLTVEQADATSATQARVWLDYNRLLRHVSADRDIPSDWPLPTEDELIDARRQVAKAAA